MFHELADYFKNNPKVLRVTIIIASFFVLIVVLGLLATIPTSKPLEPKPTAFDQESFPELIGDDIYHYNGLSFMAFNTKTGVSHTLSKPVRLPHITSVHYVGNHGALLSFDRSIHKTSAEPYINSHALDELNENAMNYLLWYFDFTDGAFYSVSAQSFTDATYFYDSEKQLAYIASPYFNEQESDAAEATTTNSLLSFNPKDKKLTRLFTFSNVDSLVGFVVPCEGYEVCVSSSENDTNTMFGYKDNQLTNLFSTSSRIIPTNNSSRLLLVKGIKEFGDIGGIQDSNSQAVISSYDMTTKKTQSLGVRVQNATTVVPVYGDKSLTIYSSIDQQSIATIHVAPSILAITNKHQSQKDADPSLLPYSASSYSSSGESMLIKNYANTFLYAGNGILPTKQTTPPTQLVLQCAEQQGASVEYTATSSLYSLYVPADSSFRDKVGQIGNCILKNQAATFGYMFEVMGTDPASGRIVTD